ncbi:MAG: histidinol dehydrogenase [Sphaerochaetaceae bacterium]
MLELLINPPLGVVTRPQVEQESLTARVASIIEEVKAYGDRALFSLTQQYDKVALSELMVPQEALKEAHKYLEPALKEAIKRAMQNIYKFHVAQRAPDETVETEEGVLCWRKSVPLERIGIYIPGGSAPLFSTLLMLAVPAQIAGCQEIIVTTPAQKDGSVHPAILYAASLCKLTKIFKVGGAQAIAALAYGSESIPRVDKIYGPGNRYVTEAKQQVAQKVCAIDLPAGPSEVMVVIDALSNTSFAAADLISQAEHDSASQVVLVVVAEGEVQGGVRIVEEVRQKIVEQTKLLKRQAIINEALKHSWAVVITDSQRVAPFINDYAPEHLIINTANYRELAEEVQSAGSVFLGKYACESIGDYAAGTNHTLPTSRWARSFSGVSLDSFYKKITFQEITKEGLQSISESVKILAEAESLQAHANAVQIRLNQMEER